MGPIFLFLIAAVFSHKINSGENILCQGPGVGSPKRDGQFFFGIALGKNLDCGQYINGKHIRVFVKQISGNLQSVCDPEHLVRYMRPLQHPQMSRDFDTFSNFL